jgi:cytoskeletal protein RodZ
VAIGERLREARMRQKIDIADVETATKIRAKYLRALENEEFGLLPGNTFVKTFLRTYAEYLGLDPQLLLEEYRAGYEPRGEGEMQPYSVAARRRQRDRRPQRQRSPAGPPGWGTALVVLVAVVLVIFAILGLTGGEGGDEAPQDQSADRKEEQQTRREERRRGREERPEPEVTSVTLRVVPAEATYMCVDRGPNAGEPLYVGTTSDPQTFRGKHLRINSGRSSVRMTVNGERVDIAPSSEPVGYDFSVSDGEVATEELPLGERPCAT